MVLAYAATGDLKVAGAIGAADVVIKLLFYYVHERAWGRIPWVGMYIFEIYKN